MLKKTVIQGSDRVSVTFEMPPDAAARTVHVAGDFNQWDPTATAMKQRKDGAWAVTIRLPRGRSYQYRFVVNGHTWRTDDDADGLAPNEHGESNSVLSLN